MILAGDIGGTHARFALHKRGELEPIRYGTLESRSYPSLLSVVQAFLGPRPPKIAAATFGVAGPVIDQRCKATNLPWMIDGRGLSRTLRIPKLTLVNDLVALALGALTVSARRMRVLQVGRPKKTGGNIAVIAAGTGLGEASLVWDGKTLVPCASEGAHVDFAARNALEFEICEFFRERFGHVSYERVASGPAFSSLYDFFVDKRAMRETPACAARLEKASDRNVEIARLGTTGESEIAKKVVELFVGFYGAEAGNLALKTFATAGVYVCGSIAANMVEVIEGGPFLESFLAKGRMGRVLEKVPVAVVLDSDIGLAGSAYHAFSSVNRR